MPPAANRYILGGAWNEPGLHVQRPGRAVAVRAPADAWIPLHQGRSARGSFAGAYRDSCLPSRDLREGETGQRAGVPDMAQPLRLRPRRPEREGGVRGRFLAGRGAWKRSATPPRTATSAIPAYLFLPKNAKPPYQVMIVFPGANVIHQRSSPDDQRLRAVHFIMRSGRALLYPDLQEHVRAR